MPFSMKRLMAAGCISGLLFIAGASNAAELHIYSGDSFETAVENLNPGDILTVHEGTYSDSGRISISVRGSREKPVLVQGAGNEQRPLITRQTSASRQNTINIEGATHLTIRGLEITSNGGDGINLSDNPSYITLEELEIHDIAVGINFRSDMHHITVRRNRIYDTSGTGEGMYVGCNHAACAVTDSIIENNWVHNTLHAQQGDGIEVKRGSHSNIIRDNVIHDTNWPCILLYGTEGNPRNIVEGNVMWNCGDSGIQVAADAIVRNNIILHSPENGLNSQIHQSVSPSNIEFVHNTIVGGDPCLRISGWDSKPGMVFANNVVYCPSGSYAVDRLNGVAIAGNVFLPATRHLPMNGYTVGRSVAEDFLDAESRNVYPTPDSPILNAGDSSRTTNLDFNGTLRLDRVDAGAYTWTTASNPGWTLAPGFKGTRPSPTLAFVISPSTVAPGDVSSLTWSTTNATGCVASSDWNGAKPTSGSESTGASAE